jgi:hypothetical protein
MAPVGNRVLRGLLGFAGICSNDPFTLEWLSQCVRDSQPIKGFLKFALYLLQV